MTGRKIISPHALNTWLTDQIQKVVGCHDCKLTWKYRLQEPEKHGGCNWSGLNLRYGEGTDHTSAVNAAITIERDAYEKFNLEEEQLSARNVTSSIKLVMLPRLLYGPIFHLDANLINARRELDPINSMERWRDDGVILLAMAGIAHEEARAGKGGNVEERKRKAARHLYTIKSDEPVRADDTYSRVEKILWGEATNQNQANDVEVVCEAILWSAILVTRDGGSKTQRNGILGNRDKLHHQFGVQILRPEEAAELIKTKIAERDEFNAQVAALTSAALPEWAGRD